MQLVFVKRKVHCSILEIIEKMYSSNMAEMNVVSEFAQRSMHEEEIYIIEVGIHELIWFLQTKKNVWFCRNKNRRTLIVWYTFSIRCTACPNNNIILYWAFFISTP